MLAHAPRQLGSWLTWDVRQNKMTDHPIALPEFEFPAPTDRSDEKLLHDVRNHGWHVVAIAEDEVGPGFAFTIGLYLRTKQPEILIMGVPPEPSTRVLNSVGDYLMQGGRLESGKRYPGFVDRCDVIFRPVAKQYFHDYLGCARWFYRPLNDGFPVLQCLWPDLEVAFPFENGFAEKLRSKQIDLSA